MMSGVFDIGVVRLCTLWDSIMIVVVSRVRTVYEMTWQFQSCCQALHTGTWQQSKMEYGVWTVIRSIISSYDSLLARLTVHGTNNGTRCLCPSTSDQ